jgi:hypothetical protein
LVDYGDEPAEYLPNSPGSAANRRQPRVCPAGADQRGGWRTDLGKVNNTLTSGEDHEIFCRLRRFNLYSGFYDPEIAVRHYVPARRLTRRYFRQWFYWSGRTHALMLDDLYPHIDMTRVMRIAGMPRFLWRQTLQQFGRWLTRAVLARRRSRR